MSTAVEVKKAVVEEVPAAVKSVKEKKAKAPKDKKAKSTKTAAHPPYFQMIKEALLSLNERTGSSPHAIAKVIEEKHKTVLPANFRKVLGLQLKNFSSKGKLIKIKASYKLSEAGEKVTGTAVANAEKKPAPEAKKSAKHAKKTEVVKKKVAVKPAKKATQTKKKLEEKKEKKLEDLEEERKKLKILKFEFYRKRMKMMYTEIDEILNILNDLKTDN